MGNFGRILENSRYLSREYGCKELQILGVFP